MIDWYDYTNTFHKKTFPNDGNLDSLSEEYQRELASIWRLSDVYNGGYIQFIGNWGLVTHRYAVKALENIGAVKKETILKDCYSALMKYYIDGKGYTEIRDCIPNAVYQYVLDKSYEFMMDKENVELLGIAFYKHRIP